MDVIFKITQEQSYLYRSYGVALGFTPMNCVKPHTIAIKMKGFKMVKIVSDELITQINDQLKTVVEDAVKKHIENMDWSHELDIYGLVQDELSQMDMLDYMDTTTLDDKIDDKVDRAVDQLTIERNK